VKHKLLQKWKREKLQMEEFLDEQGKQ